MGSSFVEFRGRGYWARDGCLEVWLHCLVQQVDALPVAPDWLRELRDKWQISATLGAPGYVPTYLDDYLDTEGHAEVVLDLSERALAWVRSHGTIISKEELNRMGTGGPGSAFLTDLSVDRFVDVGDYFMRLLRGEVGEVDQSLRAKRYRPPGLATDSDLPSS